MSVEEDDVRQKLFEQIERRQVHFRVQDRSDSDDSDDSDENGLHGDAKGDGDGEQQKQSQKAPAYPSKQFDEALRDKIVILGINAHHLASDRDLQRLMLDQTTRLVLSPAEVTQRVAERWMLKKLLDAQKETGVEDHNSARWLQRRFRSSLEIEKALHHKRRSGLGHHSHNEGGNEKVSSKGLLAKRMFTVYHDTLMSIAEQIVELRQRRELFKQRELLRMISEQSVLPGYDSQDEDDGPSKHFCGRSSRVKLPKALVTKAKSARRLSSPRRTQANTRSWWRLDEYCLKWSPRMSLKDNTPVPIKWGPLEQAYQVEWEFMQKTAALFHEAVRGTEQGVDVFTYQKLEAAVKTLGELFKDVDRDAVDEVKYPVVPVGRFVGQRRLNGGHCENIKKLKDRLAEELPCSMEQALHKLSNSADEIGEQMKLFDATRTVQRTLRGHMARKHAARKRAQVKFAAKKVKSFILRKVMYYVTRLRKSKVIQAAMRGCIQRRRFAEKKLALVIVTFLRDCKPKLLELCWELLQHLKEHRDLHARNAPISPDFLKRGFQLRKRVPPRLVRAFEFCADIKMPGFGMLLRQRPGSRKIRHRPTLEELPEEVEGGASVDTEAKTSSVDGPRTPTHRPKTPELSLSSAAPGTTVRKTLSGADMMFEALKANQQSKRRKSKPDTKSSESEAKEDPADEKKVDEQTAKQKAAQAKLDQIKLTHRLKCEAVSNTIYWWMAHRPPEEVPYLRYWNETALEMKNDELSAAEDRLLGRRKFAFRKTLLQVRGKKLVQELMQRFRDFNRHFLDVGKFSPNVRRQFEMRPPNSSYLPQGWGSKFRLYGVLRDQRQLQEDPSMLTKGYPREGWVDPETGEFFTLKQWVVQHLVAHSYEDGGVNPMILYERNRRPKTREERDQQKAMMAAVAGKPHLVTIIEKAMPLVKFAKLVQRHVHLSEKETASIIDEMQLRHPELAIVTATDYARFIRSATVTHSPRKGPDDMKYVDSLTSPRADEPHVESRGKTPSFAFSALFMMSKVDAARRLAATMRIQSIWTREVRAFRMRHLQRRLENEQRLQAMNNRKALEVQRSRRLSAARRLQKFWRRVLSNFQCDVTRRIHPSNFFCRLVPRFQAFQPKDNVVCAPGSSDTSFEDDSFDTEDGVGGSKPMSRWVEVHIKNPGHDLRLLIESECDFEAFELATAMNRAASHTAALSHEFPLREGWFNISMV